MVGFLERLFGGGEQQPTEVAENQTAPFSNLSSEQRTLLGLAALQDAFTALGGREGTALQRMIPLSEQIGWGQTVAGLTRAAPPGGVPVMQPQPQVAAQPAETGQESGFGRSVINRALDRLGRAEAISPTQVNRFGYAGQYQIGAPLAVSAGVYRPAEGEINEQGRWSGQWGGTFNIPGFENVRTLQDFLENPQAQRRAAELAMQYQGGRLEGMGLLRNVGEEIDGVRITPEALLQGAWLGGPGGVERFVRGGGQDRRDAFGTPVSRWMRLGENEPAVPAPQVGGAQPIAAPPPGQPAGVAPAGAALNPQQAALLTGASPTYGMPPQQLQELLRRLGPTAGRQFLGQLQMFELQSQREAAQQQQRAITEREKENISTEAKLRGEFLERGPVREYYSVLPQIREIRSAASRENPSRINDINLVFAFAKMLDPTSVVREGEQIQILRSQGLDGVVVGAINRLNGGSGLLPETRAQLLREANSRFENTQNIYEQFADQWRGLARDYGVNPNRVVRPISAGQSPDNIPGQTATLPQSRQDEFITNIRRRMALPPNNPEYLSREQAIAGATNAGIPNASQLFMQQGVR